MANEQAFNQLYINMRIIEQNTAALAWLEEYRFDLVKAESDSVWFKISPQTRGSGLNGFKEAEYRLNDWMKVHSLALIDGAIADARGAIKRAEEQIKEWSQRL